MNFDWQIDMYIKCNTIYFNTNEDNCLQHEVLEAQQDDVGLGVWVEVILFYFQDMMMTSSFLHSYKHKYLKGIRFIVPVSNISRYLIDF